MNPQDTLFVKSDLDADQMSSTGSTRASSDTLPSSLAETDGDEVDSIAVIGFSFKFPQEATTADAFWKMLNDSRCAMTDFPDDRLNIGSFYHADTNRRGTIPVRGGHFLKQDLAAFDAPFFSITPSEAACMDPQQRLLLETTYQALENAGIPLQQCCGSQTSVYMSSFNDDYKDLVTSDPEQDARYAATGLASSMLANRISWFFDLNGPSTQLDSACSGSLTALHIACQGLRNGEASMELMLQQSLVGGSNLFFHPDSMLVLDSLNFLSTDSRCWSFDERANGYGRGEGIAVVVLKRLTDAVRDGDTIRAVIRATALNQDGRTPGITQPSGRMQEVLIRDTYRRAGLDMSITRFFEAHGTGEEKLPQDSEVYLFRGTGTAVGDPIEAAAIGNSFKKHRTPEKPLYVGAVKSNIGHLEGASGIAGLIKTILVLEKGVIPPNAGFEHVNPRIDPTDLHIQFPLRSIPWPSRGLRRASLNSFGFGGSNAHVVVDDAYHHLKSRGLTGRHNTVHDLGSPPSDTDQSVVVADYHPIMEGNNFRGSKPDEASPILLVWSTADEEGMKRLSSLYEKYFRDDSHWSENANLKSLAYTLVAKRTALTWKSFLVAPDIARLRAVNSNLSKAVRSSDKRGIVFVFTGQGAQYARMGQGLIRYPTFSESLRQSEAALYAIGCPWSLLESLHMEGDNSLIDRPEYSQSVCTALQIALIDLLRKLNIHPVAVIGHSSGEIAAAYCIGAISRTSALRLAYCRGVLAARLASSGDVSGAMMSIGLSETDAHAYLERLQDVYGSVDITVGCINSPTNVTITGDRKQMDTLESMLRENSVFVRRLAVDVAYHSRHMEYVATEYSTLIQDLEVGHTAATTLSVLFSTVAATQVSALQLRQSEYWVNNMVSPVRFSETLARVCTQSGRLKRKRLGQPLQHQLIVTDVLELGPRSALKAPIREILRIVPNGGAIQYHSALVRDADATQNLLEVAGRLHCSGYPVDLLAANRVSEKSEATLTNLPEYSFDHSRRHWLESRTSKNYRFRKSARLDLLGAPSKDWNPLDARWQHVIRLTECPWIGDHKMNGTAIYPAAGMLVMAIEATRQLPRIGDEARGFQFRNVVFLRALNVSLQAEGTEVQFSLQALKESSGKEEAGFEFRLWVLEGEDWAVCCHGHIRPEYEREMNEIDAGQELLEKTLFCERAVRDGFAACDQSMSATQLYQVFNDMGAGYGLTFQVLEDVCHNGTDTTAAKVKLRKWTEKGNGIYEQPHVIHPTTLDGLFQLIVPALIQGGRSRIPTMVPTRINRLWVAASGLSDHNDSMIRACALSRFKGYRETESSVVAVSSSESAPRIVMEGLETTFVTNNQSSDAKEDEKRHLCCHLHWRLDLDLMDNAQIQEFCEATRPAEPPLQAAFYEDLRLAIFSFIQEAVDHVNGKDRAGFEPHIVRYIEWMELQLQRCMTGELTIAHDHMARVQMHTDFRTALLEKIQQTSTEGRFFVEVGRNLISMLDGVVDPLDLLFKGDLAERYYHELNGAPHTFTPFATYLDTLAHKNPSMKILEIGAGTGGATLPILDVLKHHGDKEAGWPRFAEYDFTDVSPAFFEAAREKFGNGLERMSFKTLDIEKDPLAQGYEEGTYDLMIAANVLHATQDLSGALVNTRRLLKPGCPLVLFEVTEPHVMRTGFAFGLLKGWWLATQEDGRWSPCLSEEAWNDAMSRTGFSGLDIVLPDSREEACHEASILITTARMEEPADPVVMPNIVIVLDEECPMQQDLAQELHHWLPSMGELTWETSSLQEVAQRTDLAGVFCILLLEIGEPFLSSINEGQFAQLKDLIKSNGSLLWVTQERSDIIRRPDFDMVTGFAKALRSEYSQLSFVTLALDNSRHPHTGNALANAAQKVIKVLQRTVSLPAELAELDYAEREGQLLIGRVIEADYLNRSVAKKTSLQHRSMLEFGSGPALSLHVPSPGLLDSLEFREDKDLLRTMGSDEVEVEVMATGVNFRDCLMALGQLNDSDLGTECAGVIKQVGCNVLDFKRRDRVAVCSLGTYKSFMRCKASCVVRIPDNMSFVEAAALPTVGITAYHALYDVARLRAGESVLIHSGAGGTGQLAIQIAQHLQAIVYVTVSSEAKKRLLMDKYALPDDCFFYSRDDSFAQGIKRVTHGRGVDVVLNSLSGDSLTASWDCVAPFGRFVEIGKKDILAHADLPMFRFAKNVTFAAVDLADIIRERPSMMQDLFQGMMALLEQGSISAAQPVHVFPASKITTAFRALQGGKHVGKIVIEYSKDDLVPTLLDNKPAYFFHSNASYLIAGGLGGLGRSITQWMASRGARYFILLSRSGARSSEAKALHEELHSQGCRVETPACDIAHEQTLKEVLDRCAETMPPIRGCMQATMVLKDTIFENMTHADFTLSTAPKTAGSWNLHKLLPRNLDHFILLSSITGIFGAPSQANYTAGNTYQDALAAHRLALGERAAALDLGMITSAGILAQNHALRALLARTGFFMPITQPELFALLDHYCNPDLPLVHQPAQYCQPIVGIELPAVLEQQGRDIPAWMHRPLFRHFFAMRPRHASESAASGSSLSVSDSLAARLRHAATDDAVAESITHALAEKTVRILGVRTEDLDTAKPLHSFGVDSLVAVEIRNWIGREVGVEVGIFDLLGGRS
ncbi:MAG: hypothetical protein L6R35_002669, partial [Caloplaca aegaea]